jgi:hypothetical protein
MILARWAPASSSKLAQADEPHLDAISALALDFLFFLLLEIESCLK